jgi:hypothetical protein
VSSGISADLLVPRSLLFVSFFNLLLGRFVSGFTMGAVKVERLRSAGGVRHRQ